MKKQKFLNYKDLRKEWVKNPDFRKARKELAPEFKLLRLIINRRVSEGLTQRELAKKIGTKQSAISRFESGRYNPTLSFLHKLADALDVKLKITVTK